MWQKVKNQYHLGVAFLSNVIYSFPSKRLKVIGVTGTDGKTTTVNLIYHILKEAGYKVSMVSTVGAEVGGKKITLKHHVTTPSSFSIQNLISMALSAGSEYFVLEVTSHALDQNRVWGIPFEVGVLTNVSGEHLDYHKTYDNYLKTKEKLLKLSKIAVLNRDDQSYPLLTESKKDKDESSWVSYGLTEGSELNPTNFKIGETKILGEFNKYNILAAALACRMLGVSDENIKKALSTFKMPKGRVDYVYDDEFKVMIDFAHTSNSFEQLLGTLKKETTGKIIHVFGSAGERDKSKRQTLGEISSQYSDILVLTGEDPRSEDVNKIIDDISQGASDVKAEIIKIPDRSEAINAAIKMAEKDDLVLLTGKAHERSINYGSGEEDWDEYRVVNQALRARGINND